MRAHNSALTPLPSRAFVGALIRLANLKFDKGGTLGERFDRLVATHLTHHVLEELHLVTDEFSEQMETKLMRAVRRHCSRIYTSRHTRHASSPLPRLAPPAGAREAPAEARGRLRRVRRADV